MGEEEGKVRVGGDRTMQARKFPHKKITLTRARGFGLVVAPKGGKGEV